jgi:hypothetical protein
MYKLYNVHPCSRAHVHPCTCAPMLTCTCAPVLACTCAPVLACTCAPMLTCVHTHVLPCSRAHVHMCSRAPVLPCSRAWAPGAVQCSTVFDNGARHFKDGKIHISMRIEPISSFVIFSTFSCFGNCRKITFLGVGVSLFESWIFESWEVGPDFLIFYKKKNCRRK